MVDAKQKLVEVTRSFSFINIFGEIENVPIHFSRGEHPNCRKNGYKKGHAPMGGALKGRLKGKHCSPTTEFKKGHKTPKAIQEKITKAITGLRKGIPLSEAHCKALSQAKLGKPAPHKAGANCTFWKGGITEKNRAIRMSLEYKNWRRAVFERDDIQKHYSKTGL